MKTIKIKVYEFNELSETVRERVKDSFVYDNPWENEIINSMRRAEDVYDEIKRTDLSGLRLYKWIVNNILPDLTAQKKYYVSNSTYNSYFSVKGKIYDGEKARFSKIFKEVEPTNLTGVCFDYDFLGPLFNFLNNPIGKLDHVNVNKIYETICEDEEISFFKDENFSDFCDANDYYFFENGKMY